MSESLRLISGIYTALATPFTSQGEIDFPRLTKLLEQQVRLGIRGFVVCGTTGESPTLSRDEKENLFRFIFDFGKGKNLDLIAGTGTNDTRETIALTKLAESIGYRRVLVVVPYYNRPSATGLQAHFEAVANASHCEIILYNVPGRTGISLTAETIVALAAHPRITGIKEASGKLDFLAEITGGLKKSNRSLQLLSGDDETYLGFLRGGGHGVISVSSHIIPTAMLEIEASVRDGKTAKGDALQSTYLPFFKDLFLEANPTPLKWFLSRLEICENRFRLPLVPVGRASEERLAKLEQAFRIEAAEYRG